VVGRGRLLREQSMAEFIADASSEVVRVRSPQADRLAALLGGEGVTVRNVAEGVLEVEGLPSEQVGITAAQAQITLYELSVQGASLEEAYMALTRDAVDYRSSVGSAHDDLAQAVAA
jgi:ABC-2 type transport system ATP-binding protein